jgi:hypothetical protein
MQSTQKQADQIWSDLVGTPAAILRMAARYLAQYGWANVGFYNWTDPADRITEFPPADIAGAIRCAVFGYPVESLYTEIVDPNHDTNATRITGAQVALADEIDPEWHVSDDGCPGGIACALEVIIDWNDVDGRTLPQVLEALYSAADEWERIQARADVAVAR